MDEVVLDDDVWLGWIGRRLWCSLPWQMEALDDSHGTIMIFDPELGSGAWTQYKPARGTIACIVERSDVHIEYPMVVTCGCTQFAGVMRVGVEPDLAGDQFTAAEGLVPFRSRYRTGWKHAGWPERQKSWLRPRVISRIPPLPVTVRMDTYWNYDNANIQRTHVFDLLSAGGVFWRETGAAEPQGFDWGDGTLWTSSLRRGDIITRPYAANPASRGTSLGWSRAVQLEFKPEDYTLGLPWSVDAVILKFNTRRFTT
jgi:hypothetical protein